MACCGETFALPTGEPVDATLLGTTYAGAVELLPEHSLAPLTAADLDLGWCLDFHFPRGLRPLSCELVSVLAACSRAAAEQLPAANGRGLECRMVGTHVYTAGVPVLDPGERAARAAEAADAVTAYPDGFQARWRAHVDRLDTEYAALAAIDLHRASRAELHRKFDAAVAHYGRAWEVHFEVMYPMLAVAERFRTVCRSLGIGDTESADLLSSGDSAIRRTDVALRALAERVSDLGLQGLFADASGLGERLHDTPAAAEWLAEFAQFLGVHGQRSDAIVDVGAVAWADDPSQPLALVRDLVLQGLAAATDGRLDRVEASRELRCKEIVARLGTRDRAVFLDGLRSVRNANFAWWNEDHNAVIDLRAHLPVGRIAGELAVRYAYPREAAGYMFAEEVRELGHMRLLGEAIAERRNFDEHWRGRRVNLPRFVGTPSAVNDPVLAEIVGIPVEGAGDRGSLVLHGLGASHGVARGPARVVLTPDELHRIRAGDVLVCDATSPSWTVAFPGLAACVCATGGPLTHAAIICREYGLPCVSGVGNAMQAIKDGELVEVDGRNGTVTLLGGGA